MSYGIMIVLQPDPEEWNSTTGNMRAHLGSIAEKARTLVRGLSGRTVVDHTPLATPPRAQVNVWIDDAADSVYFAMTRASACALALSDHFRVSSVEVFDWEYHPILAQ